VKKVNYKADVIVPAYNQAAVILSVVRELCGRCENTVVVDDGSTDGTVLELEGPEVALVQTTEAEQ